MSCGSCDHRDCTSKLKFHDICGLRDEVIIHLNDTCFMDTGSDNDE